MKTLVTLFLFVSLASYAGEPTFVYLVRHAEKLKDVKDPELSPLGEARVKLLEHFFEKISLDGIYSSQYRRTKQTVESIAKSHGLSTTIIKAQDPDAQIAAIKAKGQGTFLISGHSNTVPALIKKFGGPDLKIDETEYDNLFLLVLDADGGCIMQQFQVHPKSFKNSTP